MLLAVCVALDGGCQPRLAPQPPEQARYAIAVHGGAGLEPEKLTADEKKEYHASLKKAIEVGRKILANGGTALDAVEQTVRALEDDPLYNAGVGAVFNAEGKHELDASIMDGSTGLGGGVAGRSYSENLKRQPKCKRTVWGTS
jgi:beta-aspartyl-peptidase (threonine type)